jgi:hypothetical protein
MSCRIIPPFTALYLQRITISNAFFHINVELLNENWAVFF